MSITQVQHTSTLVGVSGPVDLLQPHKPTLGMPHIYPLKALLHGTITTILFQDLNCFLSRHGGCLCIKGLRMCTQAGIQLTVPQYSTILNIVCALQHQFYPGTVKLVPGGMDHYCTECTQPYCTHMEVPVPNPHGWDVAPNTLNGQLLVRYSTWFNSDLHLTSHARITM